MPFAMAVGCTEVRMAPDTHDYAYHLLVIRATHIRYSGYELVVIIITRHVNSVFDQTKDSP